MNASHETASGRLMDRIEEERAHERTLRRVAMGAWVVVGVVLLAWIGLTVTQAVSMAPLMRMAGGPGLSVLAGIFTPVIIVMVGLAVLAGTLSTVALFLRQRRATFDEIQLRLATLEELLTSRDQRS